ncbi:MAG: DNA polymerase III subunit epsilon [Calditrichaeota bacterium]|nr:MAG: DNA polymerase III subunit epsilon [Calditrichota bacterium]MBL1207724.1 DNA polymerase III subunit epsilon [Calditrichota bacterium]NOG47558.1 DNA polymerase III subunit epsilon [Calditrichota bacterium]
MARKHKILLWLTFSAFLPAIIFLAVVFGFWFQLNTPEQEILLNLLKPLKTYLILSLFTFLFILGFVAKKMFSDYFIPLQKLIEDAEVMKNSPQKTSISSSGAKTIQQIAGLFADFAIQKKDLQENVNKKITEANINLEKEKNILASLISELQEGVLICNIEGQILLYNKRVQQYLSSQEDETGSFQRLTGIGRSVFKSISKEVIVHALDEIQHKIEHKDDHFSSQLVLPLPSGTLARMHVVPVLGKNETMTGFIIIMYDVSEQLEHDIQRYEMIQALVRGTRSSAANIRAAIESVISYKDMDSGQLSLFHNVINDEASSLTEHLNSTIEKYKKYFSLNWPLENISANSLLRLTKRKLADLKENQIEILNADEHLWLKVENFSFINMILFLIHQLNEHEINDSLKLNISKAENFNYFDILWSGKRISQEKFDLIINEQIAIAGLNFPYTVLEIIDRHNGRIWLKAEEGNQEGGIRILLKPGFVTDENNQWGSNVSFENRPEFYDFDLFSQRANSQKWEDIDLSSLKFVVFDTETTGLDPANGDEIISIGAVRIVNNKILSGEQYEQLIDPQRKLPKAASEITGITSDMLKGQPTIDKVLPLFHGYAEETILVAHNAAFDMRFLQLKENQLNLRFENPVLDTLLLSAFIHPHQESHSLDTLAKRFELTNIGRHTALGDAIVTAEVFIKLIDLLKEKGISTLGQALEASQKTYYARIKY